MEEEIKKTEEVKKKAMISQPMKDLTEEEIKKAREKAVKELEWEGFEVVDTLFPDYSDEINRGEIKNVPLKYLSKSLSSMAECDAVWFCEGWSKARGCILEHTAAEKYGVMILGYAE